MLGKIGKRLGVLSLACIATFGGLQGYKHFKNLDTFQYLYDNERLQEVLEYKDGAALVAGGDSKEIKVKENDLLFYIGYTTDGILNVTNVDYLFTYPLQSSYLVQAFGQGEKGYKVVACDTEYEVPFGNVLLTVYFVSENVFRVELEDPNSTSLIVHTLPNVKVLGSKDGVYDVEVSNNYLYLGNPYITAHKDEIPKGYYFSEDNNILMENK